MREIKFRAWHQHNKKMIYGPTGDTASPSWVLAMCSANNIEPMQYTGLKDKNGKEIYEGDLLQDNEGVGGVEWVQEHCAFLIFTRNPSLYHKIESDGILKNTEVIGNIHEHPHLLESKGTESTEILSGAEADHDPT